MSHPGAMGWSATSGFVVGVFFPPEKIYRAESPCFYGLQRFHRKFHNTSELAPDSLECLLPAINTLLLGSSWVYLSSFLVQSLARKDLLSSNMISCELESNVTDTVYQISDQEIGAGCKGYEIGLLVFYSLPLCLSLFPW